MFATRSLEPERIDTGDYTPAEYERFLKEIRFINRATGDLRTLKKTLFRAIERDDQREFSVLDVGAGSGEMLGYIAQFASRTGRKAKLTGLDLNEISARTVAQNPAIATVRADALRMPFGDDSVDYAICSLFTHHLSDEQVINVLQEMSRVSRRGIFVIDLHRHAMAYALYQVFCVVFRLSPLVREDGSLSIKRGFKPTELLELGKKAGLVNASVKRYLVYRLALKSSVY